MEPRRFKDLNEVQPNMSSMMAPINKRDVNNSAPELKTKPIRVESAIIYPSRIDHTVDTI